MARSGRVPLADRVLAEAVTALERIDPAAVGDGQADETRRLADGDFEQRIIARAKALPVSLALKDAIDHVRHAIALTILAAVILVTIGGAAAARAVLGGTRDEPVNFYFALGSLLGLQTIILLVWLILMIASKRVGTAALAIGSLGGLIVRLAQRLAMRLHKGPEHAAAVAALSAVYLRGKLGKWTLSSISNGLWLSFNVGCLAVLVALLSTRQYTFAWETTYLSDKQYVPLTQAIAALPRQLGFLTPTEDQIRESEWSAESSAPDRMPKLVNNRQEWAGLLVGSLVAYGFGPRLLLFALCLGQRRHARSRYRIDISRPEYVRLQRELMPDAQSIGIVGEDAKSVPHLRPSPDGSRAAKERPRGAGQPAIIGFEISPSSKSSLWPPPLHAVRWLDLGFVESRADQKRVLDQLASGPSEPSAIVVVAALTTTPDRGVATFLDELRCTVSRAPAVVLTGGQAFRQRADATQLDHRISDWHALARSVGVHYERVIEVDLDHLTHASTMKLAALIDAKPLPGAQDHSVRRIETAFDLIATNAERWLAASNPPEAAEQVELHRQIAKLYRDEQVSWRALLAMPSTLSANVGAQLKGSADRVIGLLPARLRRSPKWMAAGAAAGALGCVAASSLVAPVAIAALPMWSGIGAAIAAVVEPLATRSSKPNGKGDVGSHIDAAVKTAALFAVLLELQGRDESSITRVLDRVADDDDQPTAFENGIAVQAWLDQLRHRLDLALARESAR